MATPHLDSVDDGDQSHGPILEATEARGAQRVGLIWVLLISTALAATVLLGFWVFNSRHMSQATSASASGANAAAFNASSAPTSTHP